MSDLMVVVASAMRQDEARLQGIAQNLSNALTPGYKRQVVAGGAFAAQFDAAAAPLSTVGASVVGVRTLVDQSAGTLRATGSGTDIAIDGDGYFELATPDGPLYTRRGSVRLDASGRLVGPRDLPVMGAGGEIVLSGEPFTIASNGDIVQGGVTVARLRVVHFRDAGLLEPMGGGSYAQGGAAIDDAVAPVRLRVGYEENSNVDTAHEMVGLTAAMRHFEAMQKIAQGYDEVLEKSIRKLGEF
nr:flagellar hook basal-body protein [Massilia sp. PDC64]